MVELGMGKMLIDALIEISVAGRGVDVKVGAGIGRMLDAKGNDVAPPVHVISIELEGSPLPYILTFEEADAFVQTTVAKTPEYPHLDTSLFSLVARLIQTALAERRSLN